MTEDSRTELRELSVSQLICFLLRGTTVVRAIIKVSRALLFSFFGELFASMIAQAVPASAFAIPFDPARIDQSRSYLIRARIVVGQQLLFTTDQAYPVLTRGHGNELQLLMRMAAA